MLESQCPEIILMGLRRSGKTSISRVVFGNMDPNETARLPATSAVAQTVVTARALAQFKLLDFPGQENLMEKFRSEMLEKLRTCGALVFVLDCTDSSSADFSHAMERLIDIVAEVQTLPYATGPDGVMQNHVRTVDVFLHKVDTLTGERQSDLNRLVQHRVKHGAREAVSNKGGPRGPPVNVQYYTTSIFDHSVFQAFSRVVQRVVPNLATIRSLVQLVCSNSGVETGFLFGISRKIFLASAPDAGVGSVFSDVERIRYEQCSDMVDFVQTMNLSIEHRRVQRDADLQAVIASRRRAAEIAAAAAVGDDPTASLNTNDGTRASPAGANSVRVLDAAVARLATHLGTSPHAPAVSDDTSTAVVRLHDLVFLIREVAADLHFVLCVNAANFDTLRPALEYNLEEFRVAINSLFRGQTPPVYRTPQLLP